MNVQLKQVLWIKRNPWKQLNLDAPTSISNLEAIYLFKKWIYLRETLSKQPFNFDVTTSSPNLEEYIATDWWILFKIIVQNQNLWVYSNASITVPWTNQSLNSDLTSTSKVEFVTWGNSMKHLLYYKTYTSEKYIDVWSTSYYLQ